MDSLLTQQDVSLERHTAQSSNVTLPFMNNKVQMGRQEKKKSWNVNRGRIRARERFYRLEELL